MATRAIKIQTDDSRFKHGNKTDLVSQILNCCFKLLARMDESIGLKRY